MELAQLSRIFEDKTIEELQIILLRRGNDVDAAVDAIFKDEASSSHKKETHAAMTDRQPRTPPPPAAAVSGATIVALPPPPPVSETAAEEREAERLAHEQQQEQADLAKALKESMTPSDRGRLGLVS